MLSRRRKEASCRMGLVEGRVGGCTQGDGGFLSGLPNILGLG